MCEKPKSEDDNLEKPRERAEPRSYYYDDAHGYEDFDPDSDEIEVDEEEESP